MRVRARARVRLEPLRDGDLGLAVRSLGAEAERFGASYSSYLPRAGLLSRVGLTRVSSRPTWVAGLGGRPG